MADGCYHQGTAGLLGAVLLGLRAADASAAPTADVPSPLLEQWVDVTDRPHLSDVALVTEAQRTDAEGHRWSLVLVEDPAALARRGLRVEPAVPPPPLPSGYTDPADGTALLARLAADAPRAGLVRLGRSARGQPIDAAWFGQDPSSGAPATRLLADHHGDEGPAWELALAVAAELSEGDGRDPELTATLDRSTIWVVPFVNPDGAADGTRTNAAGVDLNRNYAVGWSADEFRAGATPFSEPETRAIRTFATWIRPVASLSLHAGATNLGWPWNWSPTPPADGLLFEDLAETYAASCDVPGFWITQGGDWYLTRGDTNDWAYGRYGVLDLTLELSEPKMPPASEVDALVATHLQAVLGLLSEAPDLSGHAVDALTGRPVEARISVEGAADTFGDPLTGRFHRRLPPGVDEVVVSAPGYVAATVGAAGGEVTLVRGALGDGGPEPSVVVASGELRLPDGAGVGAHLVRAGEPDVALASIAGRAVVPPTAPGAWSLVASDGRAWRDAVIVADVIPSATRSGDLLRVPRTAPGPGARAFAYAGTDRAIVELAATVEDDAVVVDLGPVRGEAPLDLLIVTDGVTLGVPHPLEPTPAPTLAEERLVAVGGAACDTFPGHRSAWLVSVGLCTALMARARRRR